MDWFIIGAITAFAIYRTYADGLACSGWARQAPFRLQPSANEAVTMTSPLAPVVPPVNLDRFPHIDEQLAQLFVAYDTQASGSLGRDFWRVAGEVVMQFKDGYWLFIPAGFLSDGASAPRLLWNLIPPWGQYGNAAIGHDILCEYLVVWDRRGSSEAGTDTCNPVTITRAQADGYLRQMMKATGVAAWRRWAIYVAVRTYAFFAKPSGPQARYDKRLLEDSWRRDYASAAASRDTRVA